MDTIPVIPFTRLLSKREIFPEANSKKAPDEEQGPFFNSYCRKKIVIEFAHFFEKHEFRTYSGICDESVKIDNH